LHRDDIETGLEFLGLLLLRNEVKADSASAIAEIKSAGMDCAMLTGDSVYTGATVARQVGIIPIDGVAIVATVNPITRSLEWHTTGSKELVTDMLRMYNKAETTLCVTGEAYELLRATNKLDLNRTKVFGRVSPGQKADLVRLYSDMGKVVVMCGDGGNDSGALKSAHAGLAINGKVADATVAAPFSTNSDSLSALTLLIRESRASLCTSLASYRTLVVIGLLYCINKLFLLLQAGAFFSGLSYLYLDVVTTPLILYAICHSLPAKRLASSAPEGSLLGPEMVTAIVWTLAIDLAFLGLADILMINQPWYVPFETDVPLYNWQARGNNFEAGLLFIWCGWVYLDAGIVYSYGALHRRVIWTNWRLIVVSACLITMLLSILFSNSSVFTCSFKVNCSSADQLAASDAFINHFLFHYEKVGGQWYGVVDSTEFPLDFRWKLFAIFMSMSIAHHIGYKVIVHGPIVNNFFKRDLGWVDGSSCCARRKRVSGAPKWDSGSRDSLGCNHAMSTSCPLCSPHAVMNNRK
jgi:magnesium-transporting ATPase (P-type)